MLSANSVAYLLDVSQAVLEPDVVLERHLMIQHQQHTQTALYTLT
jgi:hypothetical protein